MKEPRMIENLDIGDMVVFKDGFEGVIDYIEQKQLAGILIDYHLNTGYWVRYIPGKPEINQRMECQIAKVIRHDKRRGNTQR